MTIFNVFSLLCGCSIPIILGAIVFVSEWLKFMMDWDGSYLGMSWLKIWRIERAYKRGDMKNYKRLKYDLDGKHYTHPEDWESRL